MTKPTPLRKCLQITEESENTSIRVYTFQTLGAVEQLMRSGTLTCTKQALWQHSDYAGQQSAEDGRQAIAYDWMREAMMEQTGECLINYPIWAWLKRPNLSGKERKLRRSEALITAVVPRGRMLISDYVQWHCCLNGGAVTISEDEDQEYDDLMQSLSLSEWEKAKKNTWGRIFKFTSEPREQPFWRIGRKIILQACIDRIRFEEVVTIRRL